jgi:hypothetical protein
MPTAEGHATDCLIKVRVEVLIENKAEGSNTTNADIYANRKLVGRQLFTWGRDTGERLYRLTFEWDTRGFPPGEYKIRAEAFVWVDSSPFDNDLVVNQPVVLAPPAGRFPAGRKRAGASRKPNRGSGRTDWVGEAGSVPRGSHGATKEGRQSVLRYALPIWISREICGVR